MATDTKGFVLTACKDVFFVCERIEQALNKVIRPLSVAAFFADPANVGASYQTCSTYAYPGSQSVRILFKYQGISYTLCVHFTCDCDNAEYGPQSLSLSLGYHHEAPKFLKLALESLSMLGTLYFTENDGDGTRPVKLDGEPTTFIEAVAAGDILGSYFPLNAWQAMHHRGDFGKKTFEAVVGLSSDEIKAIQGAVYEESCRMVAAHAEQYKALHAAELTTAE